MIDVNTTNSFWMKKTKSWNLAFWMKKNEIHNFKRNVDKN